jgi:predicted ABC-type sugar transport system permease subunit
MLPASYWQSTSAAGMGYEVEVVANCIISGKSMPGGADTISCAKPFAGLQMIKVTPASHFVIKSNCAGAGRISRYLFQEERLNKI